MARVPDPDAGFTGVIYSSTIGSAVNFAVDTGVTTLKQGDSFVFRSVSGDPTDATFSGEYIVDTIEVAFGGFTIYSTCIGTINAAGT